MASAKALLGATLSGDPSKAPPPLVAVKAEGVEVGDVGESNGKLVRTPTLISLRVWRRTGPPPREHSVGRPHSPRHRPKNRKPASNLSKSALNSKSCPRATYRCWVLRVGDRLVGTGQVNSRTGVASNHGGR